MQRTAASCCSVEAEAGPLQATNDSGRQPQYAQVKAAAVLELSFRVSGGFEMGTWTVPSVARAAQSLTVCAKDGRVDSRVTHLGKAGRHGAQA